MPVKMIRSKLQVAKASLQCTTRTVPGISIVSLKLVFFVADSFDAVLYTADQTSPRSGSQYSPLSGMHETLIGYNGRTVLCVSFQNKKY